MTWQQSYDPLHGPLSTLAAAFPIGVLLGLLALRRVPAYVAALTGLATSLTVAMVIIGMPSPLAARAALYGAAYGFLPIGWIVLNVMFLYRLTEGRGVFVTLQHAITGVTTDRRLQLLLIAFCFGAFFEGAAGFGTPVAVTGAMLSWARLPHHFEASALSLIANTAPVAFGALGTPIIALQGVSGLDLGQLSAMVGRQLPFFSLLVPFWLMAAYSGWKGMLEIWPALFVAGITFAIPQFLVSNFHGPWLVDIIAAACSMVCLSLYLRWKNIGGARERTPLPADGLPLSKALVPWAILTVIVFAWGTPQVKSFLNGISGPNIPIPGLDKMILRMPPVLAKPTPEPAVFAFNWLSASGTAILITAILSGLMLGYSIKDLIRAYGKAIVMTWRSLLTISAMMALGYVTRYSGADAILGLRVRTYRCDVSVLRRDAGLARRGAHGERYVSKCVVWKSPATYRAATRVEPCADGGGEQLGRRDGQDDRCPEHLCRERGDGMGWTRMEDSPVRVLAFDCARGVGGIVDARAAVRVPVDDRGAVSVGGAVLGMTRGCARNDSNASLSSNRRLRINARGTPRGPVARQRGDDEE